MAEIQVDINGILCIGSRKKCMFNLEWNLCKNWLEFNGFVHTCLLSMPTGHWCAMKSAENNRNVTQKFLLTTK